MNIVDSHFSRANYSNPFIDRILAYFLDKILSNKKYFSHSKFEWYLKRWSRVDKDVKGDYLSAHYVLCIKFKKTIRVDVAYPI